MLNTVSRRWERCTGSPAAERFDRIGAQRYDSSVTACGATLPPRKDALAAQGCAVEPPRRDGAVESQRRLARASQHGGQCMSKNLGRGAPFPSASHDVYSGDLSFDGSVNCIASPTFHTGWARARELKSAMSSA